MKKLMGVAVLVVSMGGQTVLAAGSKGAQPIPGTQNGPGIQRPQSGQGTDTLQARPQGPTDQQQPGDDIRPESAAIQGGHPGAGIASDTKGQQVTGSIKSASANAIEITSPGNRGDMRFHADPRAKVTRDAKAATMADLKTGDQVRITYEMVKSERTIRSIDVMPASARIPISGSDGMHNNANNSGANNTGTAIIHK